MDLLEAIKSRRAIRKFQAKKVPSEILEKAFELAKWAPGIEAFRTWDYTIVTGERRDRLVDIIGHNTMHLREMLMAMGKESRKKAVEFYATLGGAPVIALVSAPQLKEEWQRKSLHLLYGTELQTLWLALCQLGLGLCPITLAPWVQERIREELGLGRQEIIIGLAIGYPDEQPEPPKKSKPRLKYIK